MSRLPNLGECREIFNYAITGNVDSLMQKISTGLSPDCHNVYANSASPLYGAVMYQKANIVTALLENGADVNFRSGIGETALTMAAQTNNMEIFNSLMSYNPDPNIANKAGLVPLMSASLNNNLVAVNSLISHGANVNLQMSDGSTALHIAAIVNGYTYPAQLELEQRFLEVGDTDARIRDAKGHLDRTLATMKLLLENGTPCAEACMNILMQNPMLKAAADLYLATHETPNDL